MVGDRMRYTYKKISGLIAIVIGGMIAARFVPDWLFYFVLAALTLFMLYLIYYSSN